MTFCTGCSGNWATKNADATSGIAHMVAFVQTIAFGVCSGKIPKANNNNIALWATRVVCRLINCCKPFK